MVDIYHGTDLFAPISLYKVSALAKRCTKHLREGGDASRFGVDYSPHHTHTDSRLYAHQGTHQFVCLALPV